MVFEEINLPFPLSSFVQIFKNLEHQQLGKEDVKA